MRNPSTTTLQTKDDGGMLNLYVNQFAFIYCSHFVFEKWTKESTVADDSLVTK